MIALRQIPNPHYMLRYCLLLLPVIFAACAGNETQRQRTIRTSAETRYSDANTSGDYYRRYSGTIANQPVVLQLHRFAGRYTGSYQYNNQGKMIRLSQDESRPDRISFTEYPPEAAADSQAHLFLTLQGSGITGEWVSAAGDKRAAVKLQEDYPAGSSRLLASHLDDTATLIEGKAAPFATSSYRYVLPATGDPGFLGRSLIGMLAPRQTPAGDVDATLRAEADEYFARYRRETAPMLQPELDSEALFAFNFSTDKEIEVLHNDNDWVVVRNLSGEYTGGAHGYYASSFLNIDVSGSKVWNLREIVADTNALRPMLNDAAIAYFRLKPGAGMANRLLVDEVPVTDNIFLSATGISFVYNPYEIASYADGEVMLFLPYGKISQLLTEAFRTRMKIGSRAGVALLTSEPKSPGHGRTRL